MVNIELRKCPFCGSEVHEDENHSGVVGCQSIECPIHGVSMSIGKWNDREEMTVNEMVEQSHSIALAKGWWKEERSSLEIHALIHTEISEATEEVRNGAKTFYRDMEMKPCGEAIELVDAIIRIADYFGKKKLNLNNFLVAKMSYNVGREYRHGGKKY